MSGTRRAHLQRPSPRRVELPRPKHPLCRARTNGSGTALGTTGQARVAAEAVLLLHVLWCTWVLLGWTVTRGRRVLRILHLTSLAYAIVMELLPWPPCPLTVAETQLEVRAGVELARAVPRARVRCDCLPRSAVVARCSRRSGCLRDDPGCLFEALSASPSGRYVVIRVCW
jgi:Protein of Unknown function (DUF2784)